ncbi:hypothetical protein ACHAW5_010977 [Stephanodiscus triporus]|uniref:Uncharacterized protein n=1 Tax=Stephanodiscus triporus TaxID=2934178 RepID=A0ABD3PPX3_9STRA
MEKSRGGSGGFAAANSSLIRNADEGTSGAGKSICCLHLTRTLADLDAAIAQLAYCKALPFSFGECPYFQ